MSKKQVVIELLPGRIDVVVLDGSRCAAERSLSVEPEADALEWAKLMRRSGASLKALVEQLGVAGAPAIVVYRSPTQAVDLAASPVSSAAQAIEAAKLGCTDSLPYSSMAAVCEAAVAGRDAGGERRHLHVVVAAEREDIAEAIVEMVESAGLLFVSATPLDAAIGARFVADVLRDREGAAGHFYVGEHASFFIVADAGTMLFSRRIALGTESLASSLTRPIQVADRAEPVELGLDAARAILRRHGIPERAAVVHEQPPLTGGQVIPLLQPVLQRFIVDLRQSLRFGVEEKHRERLSIRVSGPGATIPGLVELIGRELDLPAERDGRPERHRSAAVAPARGELIEALSDRRLLRTLNLQPQPLARQRRIARFRRWLWTGAAAAVLVVGVDGFRYHARLADARREAEVYRAQLNESKALEATGERLRTAIEAMQEFDRTMRDKIGLRVDYPAVLHELSRLTPETVRFTTFGLRRRADAFAGSIAGFAEIGAAGGPAQTDLEAFIARLRASPLLRRVELGNVALTTLGGSEGVSGQRFDLTFTAVPIAADLGGEHGRLAASAAEAAP